VTIFGHSSSLSNLQSKILPRLTSSSFAGLKYRQNLDIVQEITSLVATKTASKLFDSYVEMNFIDNVLRGGLPVNLAEVGETISLTESPLPSSGNTSLAHSATIPPKVFHTYSRIHGDLERDYNNFQLDPTFYSQGPGNFRDVAQNRRSDVMQVEFQLLPPPHPTPPISRLKCELL
jgi:hypothetical protein